MADVLQVWQADLVGAEVDREEWNEWYDTEHMAAILSVPGVRFGWRLRRQPTAPLDTANTPAPPEYMAVYLLDSCSVLASEAYDVARRSAGPGMRPEMTARMFAVMGRFQRGLYEVEHAAALTAKVGSDPLWYVEHGPHRSEPSDAAISSWTRFECSTVERAMGPLRPTRSARRLTLSRAGAGAKGFAYRTVFSAAVDPPW